MTEKQSIGDVSPDEKTAAQAELADPAGRRQSVALNIVENPLKVKSLISISFALACSLQRELQR